MSKRIRLSNLGLIITLLSPSSFAGDIPDLSAHLDGTLGASWSIGKLGNSGMGLNSRTIDFFSLEALPGYRFGNWFVGPDFDYRWQGQITSLDSAGGTNLRGNGWLLGVGGGYRLDEVFSIQAAINFLGRYNFNNQTSTVEDDHLSAPLGLRVKGQYMIPSVPFSIDLDLQFQRWANLTITETTYNNASTQWSAGLGISWHFSKGCGCSRSGRSEQKASDVSGEVTKQVVMVPRNALSQEQIQDFREELEKAVDVHSTEDGLVIDVQGEESFESGKSDLTAETRRNLEKSARILKKNPDLRVRIDGHADSSGLTEKNRDLSESRAESVQQVFLDAGMAPANVSIEAHGDSAPRKSNRTKKGRAENRRIEIFIE